MRKKGLTSKGAMIAMFGLALLLVMMVGHFGWPKPEKEATPTLKSYDWSYPYPPAEEFGESKSYSMVWIEESSWISKRFLLVRAKENHRDYGRLPYLLQAIRDVEKKGYTVVSKEFLTTDPRFTASGLIGSLLLEVRPPENTKNIEKKDP